MPPDTNNLSKTLTTEDDRILDLALRLASLEEYIGQERVKQNLAILMAAAQQRQEPLEHILIHGPSGLGKTTLALIIAQQMGSNLKITSGAALEKAGDLGSILTGLNDGDFLFIDEVHRLNHSVEEMLYPAMENFKLDIVIGKGNTAKTLQIQIPRFTLIAATTKIAALSNPFRSRFGVNYKLDFYQSDEIEKIVDRSAKLLGIPAQPEAIKTIAASARFTPRIANRLLKRVRDYAQVKNQPLDRTLSNEALTLLDIDQLGLEAVDRRILEIIIDKFSGGPVGLKTVAAMIGEDEDTIADVHEPYLLRLGFITRTSRGRMATSDGAKHIGRELKTETTRPLF